MKSNSFINKIKIYSVVAFLLPLLAINSCLLLYKILGDLVLYPAWNWDQKIIERTFNLNVTESYTFVDWENAGFDSAFNELDDITKHSLGFSIRYRY